jgi:hypothetical protein
MAKTEGKKNGSFVSRMLGAGSAGILELVLFHPVDTVAKRLMTFEGKIFGNGSVMNNVNQAIFKVRDIKMQFFNSSSLLVILSHR